MGAVSGFWAQLWDLSPVSAAEWHPVHARASVGVCRAWMFARPQCRLVNMAAVYVRIPGTAATALHLSEVRNAAVEFLGHLLTICLVLHEVQSCLLAYLCLGHV